MSGLIRRRHLSVRKIPDRALLTIGYEGKDASQLVRELVALEIDILLDVRYRPLSRKPGLSKRRLEESCLEVGIEYKHDRELGTPPDQMSHVRKNGGYDDTAREQYRTFLLTREGPLNSASQLLKGSVRVCLLCYESDAQDCHRSVVAEEIGRRVNLVPRHA